MSDVIELIKGQTYYWAAFFDKNLSIPSIDTYIYEGCEDEHGHLFINAEGHVAKIEGTEDADTHFIAFEIGSRMDMLDKQRLIEWLEDDHNPQQVAKSYTYTAR